MTQLTIDDLRQQFEEAWENNLNRAYGWDHRVEQRVLPVKYVFCDLDRYDIDQLTDDGWEFSDETVWTAARRFVIARDFNEFDPGKADMLWKLQNGGAQ